MSKKPSRKDQRITQLERRLLEAEAQLTYRAHFAAIGVKKADRSRTMGSGVIVTMHYIGGAEVCPPFFLKDGLSEGTIGGLCSDLKYTYERATEFRP